MTTLLISVLGFGSIISSLYGGKLCDSFSPHKVTSAALLFYFVMLLIMYFSRVSTVSLALLLFLLGLANGAFSPASRILIMRQTPVESQVRVNSIRYMLLNVGVGFSFILAASLLANDYRRIFLLAAVCVAASFIALLFVKPTYLQLSNHINQEEKPSLLKDRFALLVLISFFLGALVFSQTNTTYSLFLSRIYHLSSIELSSLFFTNAVIIVFCQVPLTNAIKKLDQITVMLIGEVTIGVGFFMLLFGDNYSLSLLSMLVLTFGEMLFIPTVQNIVYQRAPEKAKGHYMGVYQAIYASTQLFAPLLGGAALASDFSGRLLWTAAVLFCLVPLVLRLLFRKVFLNSAGSF
jgi:MFS family permease